VNCAWPPGLGLSASTEGEVVIIEVVEIIEKRLFARPAGSGVFAVPARSCEKCDTRLVQMRTIGVVDTAKDPNWRDRFDLNVDGPEDPPGT